MLIKDHYTIECLIPFLHSQPYPEISGPYEIDLVQLTKIAVSASAATAETIADCLKMGVEHSADSDPDIAHALADTIVAIGRAREDGSIVALGTMAHGDILTHLVRNHEAWDKLEEAGDLFLQAGSQFGWARTRINRVYICVELGSGYIETAFAEAAQAERVFLDAGRYDRLMRLYHAWAYACELMGEYEKAIAYYRKAVGTVEKQGLGQNTDIVIAHLYTDIGNAYNACGEFQTALSYLTGAHRVFLDAGHTGTAAMAGRALAMNYTARGKFRQAMHLLLNSVLPNLSDQRADMAKLTLIECYMALNRDHDAYALAADILETSKADPDRRYLTAVCALHLSVVQTRLGQFAGAQDSLALAETGLHEYESMVALIALRRAQVALRQGDVLFARATAIETAAQFQRWQQPVNWIDARLISAEAALLSGDFVDAEHSALDALRAARASDLEPAAYRVLTVLAQVYERQVRQHSMIRACRAALVVLTCMQRTLTLSLRSRFMDDKLLPFRRLMRAYLDQNRIEEAFEILERLKAQVFLDFLANRDSMRWAQTDETRPLLDRLAQLRDKYRWLIRLQSTPPAKAAIADPLYRELHSYSNLLHETAACEQDIRKLREQLSLYADPVAGANEAPLNLKQVQQALDDSTIMVEYYIDHDEVWCFGIMRDDAVCIRIKEPLADLQRLIEDKWHANVDFALGFGPDDPRTRDLAAKARRFGERLYHSLLAPLQRALEGKRRIMIVPYGVLHQLPFNVLRNGGRYLIETHEIVVLPSASLLTRTPRERDSGATVLANSWDGQLTYSAREAESIHSLMGGSIHLEGDAGLQVLKQSPRQVLHVSTHGEHRIDQPDFSYIELSDGAVYTDDLLQYDLSYELVVLSACEVGRAHVTAGEEMIGLGRGFLYAGAGALITSLWRVNEAHTFHLMRHLYQSLRVGESKASALQSAQRSLLAQDPELHPAFWAAFQLICNPDPLSGA
jgi:CHAT domain-containing protein